MTDPRDIPLPRPPQPPAPFSFPLLATLAPVLASLTLWGITRSPFALMFAVLGPLVAVGSLVDARLQARRASRRERARFESDVAATKARIAREHDRLRDELRRQHRGSGALLPPALHDAERWRYGGGEVPVVIGTGDRASGIRLTGEVPDDTEAPDRRARRAGRPSRRRRRPRQARSESLSAAIEALRESAAVLPGAPVSVDARLGIGICGARVPALAVARAITLQLADALPPGTFELRGGVESWQRDLPHFAAGEQSGPQRLEFVEAGRATPGARVVLVVAATPTELPRECRIGIEVAGGELRMLRHPNLGALDSHGVPLLPRSLRADFVSALDAARVSTVLSAAAEHEGLARSGRGVPEALCLDTVWEASVASSAGLPAVFLADGNGAVEIDLVSDGPHAVVGGTTGSGKSELLIGWVLAMARSRSPEEVSFLLVDFKGGSSFGGVESLPHSVGMLTDLDPASATRALESLRSEVRHRERVLASAGVRSIDELDAAAVRLPRLVVVVDEFAAMVSDFPELHALFGDLAARGRSLGVHLILCTQRPGGVVRDSVMANCSLRLSLRVNNEQDSRVLLGTDAAASLPRHPVGRCLVSVSGGAPTLAQVALAQARHIEQVADRWAGTASPRRPWLPPLDRTIPWSALSRASDPLGEEGAPAIRFGVVDLPEEQRQPLLEWRPAEEGNLLVVGGRGSGKSGVLSALAAGARAVGMSVIDVGGGVESAWDRLVATARGGGADPSGRLTLLVIDDLDALVAKFPESHSTAFLDLVTALVREGPVAGTVVAATVQRLTPAVQSLAPLFDCRLLLRLASRQEHVLAGGDGAHHDASVPPGRGRWHGREVQVALAPNPGRAKGDARSPATRVTVELSARELSGVVTTRPALIVDLVSGHAPGRMTCAPPEAAARWAAGEDVLAVGDPQGWQSAWSALPAARARGDIVFDRCSVSEFRMVSATGVLPPPLSGETGGAAGAAGVWVLSRDGSIRRGGLVDKLND